MEQRRYGFNKEQGTKGTVGRAAGSFPFIYFTFGRGEESESVPGSGLTQPLELVTTGLRADTGIL